MRRENNDDNTRKTDALLRNILTTARLRDFRQNFGSKGWKLEPEDQNCMRTFMFSVSTHSSHVPRDVNHIVKLVIATI